MDRRLFLKNTAQAGLAVSILNPMTALFTEDGSDNFKPFFKLSLAQWSLHKAINEEKTLSNLDFARKAKELGFQGVEYVTQLYSIDTGNEISSRKKLVQELKLRSNDNGIENVMIMIDNEGELASTSKVERNNAVENHLKWVDVATELNCPTVRVNLFGLQAEKDFTVWKETSIAGLGSLCEYAAKNKINVVVENHGGLSSDASKLTEVIKAVNMKNCGVLPDFGNFCVKRENGERWGSACIEEYDKYKGVAELMPFAKGVSAKSFDFDSNGNETTIDYYKMLEIVKKANYNGFIGVEYEGNNLKEMDGILATKKLLLKVAQSLSK
ncbi:sugar phosphate isomerase/epimerase family protein [Flavobacterium sp. PLA-1-15]|uniref:sugar phosphate isomerase/epimerase family protein n=1 Tax=Flavobacterium sp. PLA-1-15 TaxID=3380533 RepID=UPI003B82A646